MPAVLFRAGRSAAEPAARRNRPRSHRPKAPGAERRGRSRFGRFNISLADNYFAGRMVSCWPNGSVSAVHIEPDTAPSDSATVQYSGPPKTSSSADVLFRGVHFDSGVNRYAQDNIKGKGRRLYKKM